MPSHKPYIKYRWRNFIFFLLIVLSLYLLFLITSHHSLSTDAVVVENEKEAMKIQSKEEKGGKEKMQTRIKKKIPTQEDTKVLKKIRESGPGFMTVTFYESTDCKTTHRFLVIEPEDNGCNCFDMCGKMIGNEEMWMGHNIKSILVEGNGEIDLFENCRGKRNTPMRYWATIMKEDGCVRMHSWPSLHHIKFKKTSLLMKAHYGRRSYYNDRSGRDKYNVAYSAESSTYFGYQAHAGYYAYLTSNQAKDSVYTRLLTSSEIDDLAELIPTFQAKRHPFSKRYGPINKADVIAKWFKSSQSPKEEVIVVIDPDNWLLQNLEPMVKKVKRGHALAQRAWYGGSTRRITRMWQTICEKNCDFPLDMSAVPYFIHRDDLAAIAPLWKHYTIILKEKEESDNEFKRLFGGLQLNWCAEMYGYVFASAHVGIRHEIRSDLQVRDIGPRPREDNKNSILMLHMGRAWLPKDYEPGKKWSHTEGKEWNHFGNQVWCKCNNTANDILPWPLPTGTDFQSNATLTLLHDSREMFGKPEVNKYRQSTKHGYHAAYP